MHIPINSNRSITFATGTPVPKEYDVTYLGAKFAAVPDPQSEVNNRIQNTMTTWRKLFLFWKYSTIPTRTKLIIYHSIIKTKLCYGLETLTLPPACTSKLDAFYLKGLRQIMSMTTTFIDRSNTNERVYLNAACLLARKPVETPLASLSAQLSQKRQRLFAFLTSPKAAQPEIKATFWFPPSFEFRQVFPADSLHPNISSIRKRVGRPRGSWVREVISDIWSKIREMDPSEPPFDFESEGQRDRLIQHLQSRFHIGL